MIKKGTTLIILSLQLLALSAFAQVEVALKLEKRLKKLKQVTVTIRTSDIKRDDMSDLEPLKDLIGDSRIVMLGDQSHGHGTTFLMNGRLVRFLHEEMNFDVLIWESGLFCCTEMDKELKAENLSLYDTMDVGLFSIFSCCKQLVPMFEYIKKIRNSEDPLIVAGSDCQLSGWASPSRLQTKLWQFFNGAQPGLLDWQDYPTINYYFQYNQYYGLSLSVYEDLLEEAKELLLLLDSSSEVLQSKYSRREINFYKQVLVGLKIDLEINVLLEKGESIWKSALLREKAMADNIKFLIEEYYPNKKYIICAASFHNLRNMKLISSRDKPVYYDQDYNTTGHYVYEDFGDQIYSIAPLAFKGEVASWYKEEAEEIPEAPKKSISWYLHQLGKKYYLVDLKSLPKRHWLLRKQWARPLGGVKDFKATWPEIFDAFIYCESSIRCTKR
jgi:erythromycin esterase